MLLFEHRPIIETSERIALDVFTKALSHKIIFPAEFVALMW